MWELLAQARIQRVLNLLVDVRQYPEAFTALNRVPIVNAMDGEIFAKFKGRVVAAAVISNTGKAPIRGGTEVTLQKSTIPVIKHGHSMNRDEIRLLGRIEENLASDAENKQMVGRIAGNVGDLVEGVRVTMNAMLYGMMLDSYTYDRDKMKFTASWNMPSDLKVTLTGSDLWGNPTTAKPITNINAVCKTAKNKYGRRFNRAQMSQDAYDAMIRTDEFKALAYSVMNIGGTLVLPYQNQELMLPLATRVLGLNIEIDDTQYFVENEDASIGTMRNLPNTDVLLTSSADDNNASVWDFANAECEEAMPGMCPDMIGEFEGAANGLYGPFGYATAASPDANPPGINQWGVASGFPRKHQEAASSRLRVLAS